MIQLSENAADKIKGMLAEQDIPGDGGLRVFVKDGCCSGYSYGMTLESNPLPEDQIDESNGVRVLVDPNSLPMLQGANIDYLEDNQHVGFRISNPNAKSHCGCGNSFNA